MRVLLTLTSVWAVGAAAETELPHAVGVDRSGRAQAQSDGRGRVMVESPEHPRGLWLHLTDGDGSPLPGLQVEYQSGRDGLVAIRSLDPAGEMRETLAWTRPTGDPVPLMVKAGTPGGLPAGLASIDWRVDPGAEAALGGEETRLSGWEAVGAFLEQRWQGRPGIVEIDLGADLNLVVKVEDAEALGALVAYLDAQRPGGIAPTVQVRVLEGGAGLLVGAILHIPFDILLFEDQAMQEAVAKALRGSRSSEFSRERVARLTKLVIGRGEIQSLAGIWQLASLEFLWVISNEVVDVSPLVHLTNLETLFLSGNRIADVGPLGRMSSLVDLSVGGNRVVDVKPLAELTNLEKLNLSGNRIVDVSPLGELANLENLQLPHNQISDVSTLSGLGKLEVLNVSGNRIVDASPIGELSNLRRLLIAANPIADLSPLVKLINLRELWLTYNRMEDWSPLTDMTGLESLLLEVTGLADISVLAGLTNLRHLHLSRNQIADLGPLSQLTELRVLYLTQNRISDVSALAGLPEILQLYLAENEVDDLRPLGELSSLEYLLLEHNQVVDVSPLMSLGQLVGLQLEGNQIEDIGPLVANTGLGEEDWVVLRDNPLSEMARKEQIPALEARGVNVIY